jgi:hypothetical protein
MEIIEIVDYHINHSKETLEVKFRTNDDDYRLYRFDEINLTEVDSFGFSLNGEKEVDDDDLDFDDFFTDDDYNENEILSFLNEYYTIFPERLPEINED